MNIATKRRALPGTPISVNACWGVAAILLTWTFAIHFRDEGPDLPQLAYWALGAGATLAIFACLYLYEMGHLVVARANGIRVRRVIRFQLGGSTELETPPASARAELLIASAGPAVSGVLGAFFWYLGLLAREASWATDLVLLLNLLAWTNAVLLVFNLLPVLPLDGGRVLRASLWACTANRERATRWTVRIGFAFASLLIAFGTICYFKHHVVLAAWTGLTGVGLALIGPVLKEWAGEGEAA